MADENVKEKPKLDKKKKIALWSGIGCGIVAIVAVILLLIFLIPKEEKYEISLGSSGTSIEVELTGEGSYKKGDSVTIVAEDIDGYRFIGWSYGGNIISTDKEYTFQINEENEGEYTANYAKIYSVSTFDSDNYGSFTVAPTEAIAGETVTVRYEVNSENQDKYQLKRLYYVVAGESDQVTIENNAFTMPEGNVTIYAEFNNLYNINLTTNIDEEVDLTGEGTYIENETVTISAPNIAGYRFRNWTYNGQVVTTQQEYTIANIASTTSGTYIANYDRLYSISVNSLNGTVTITDNKTEAIANENISFTITPEENYRIESVSINNGSVEYTQDENTYSFTMPAGDIEITVVYNVEYAITIDTNSSEYIQIEKQKAIEGEQVEFKVLVRDGYRIDEVKYNDMSLQSETNTYSFNMPAENVTIVVTYVQQFEVSLASNVELENSIDKSEIKDIGSSIEFTVPTITTGADGNSYRLIGLKHEDSSDLIEVDDSEKYSFTLTSETAGRYTAIYEREYAVNVASDSKDIITPKVTKAIAGEKVSLSVNTDTKVDGKIISVFSKLYYLTSDDSTQEIIMNDSEFSFDMPADEITIYAVFEDEVAYNEYFIETAGSFDGVIFAGNILHDYEGQESELVIPSTYSMTFQRANSVLTFESYDELFNYADGTSGHGGDSRFFLHAGHFIVREKGSEIEKPINDAVTFFTSEAKNLLYPITITLPTEYDVTRQELESLGLVGLYQLVGYLMSMRLYDVVSLDYQIDDGDIIHVDLSNLEENYSVLMRLEQGDFEVVHFTNIVLGHPIFYAGDDYTVSIIGEEAFYGNQNLTKVVLPEGIEEVQTRAFCNCQNLTEIVFPSTLTNIASNAFNGCSFDYITINNAYVYSLVGGTYNLNNAQTYKVLKSVVDGEESEHDYLNSSNFNISEDDQYYIYVRAYDISTQTIGEINVQTSAIKDEKVVITLDEETVTNSTITILKRLYYRVDGSSQDITIDKVDGEYSFVMPTNDITIYAEFDIYNNYANLTFTDNAVTGYIDGINTDIVIPTSYSIVTTSSNGEYEFDSYDDFTADVMRDSGLMHAVYAPINVTYSDGESKDYFSFYYFVNDLNSESDSDINARFPITIKLPTSYQVTLDDLTNYEVDHSYKDYLFLSPFNQAIFGTISTFKYQIGDGEIVVVTSQNAQEQYDLISAQIDNQNYESILPIKVFDIERKDIHYVQGTDYNVTEIKNSSFSFIGSDITSIFIPSSIQSISNIAFSDCENLTEVTIESLAVYQAIVDKFGNSAGGLLLNDPTVRVLKSIVGNDVIDDSHAYLNSSNFNISEDGDYYVYKKLNVITTQTSGGGRISVQSSAYAGENVTIDVEETINENTISLLKRLYYTNDNAEIDIINQNGYSFIMPNKPITIHAEFESKNTYTSYQNNTVNGEFYIEDGSLVSYRNTETSIVIPNTISIYKQLTPDVLVFKSKDELKQYFEGDSNNPIDYTLGCGYFYVTNSNNDKILIKDATSWYNNLTDEDFDLTITLQNSYTITAQDIDEVGAGSPDKISAFILAPFSAIINLNIISFDYKINDGEMVHVTFANSLLEALSLEGKIDNIKTLEISNIKRGKLIAYEGEDIQVKTIAANAFANSNITDISIPSSIETIYQNAFYSCDSLTDVIINSAQVYQNAVGTEDDQIGGLLAYATTVKVLKSIVGNDVIDDSHAYLNSTNFNISEDGDYYVYQLKA